MKGMSGGLGVNAKIGDYDRSLLITDRKGSRKHDAVEQPTPTSAYLEDMRNRIAFLQTFDFDWSGGDWVRVDADMWSERYREYYDTRPHNENSPLEYHIGALPSIPVPTEVVMAARKTIGYDDKIRYGFSMVATFDLGQFFLKHRGYWWLIIKGGGDYYKKTIIMQFKEKPPNCYFATRTTWTVRSKNLHPRRKVKREELCITRNDTHYALTSLDISDLRNLPVAEYERKEKKGGKWVSSEEGNERWDALNNTLFGGKGGLFQNPYEYGYTWEEGFQKQRKKDEGYGLKIKILREPSKVKHRVYPDAVYVLGGDLDYSEVGLRDGQVNMISFWSKMFPSDHSQLTFIPPKDSEAFFGDIDAQVGSLPKKGGKIVELDWEKMQDSLRTEDKLHNFYIHRTLTLFQIKQSYGLLNRIVL